MTYQRSEFKFFQRGFKDALVLIPGWATDYRIFSNLDLDYNYLLPVKFHPDSFKKELSKSLEELHINKVSLFGWSSGGFLAVDFALEALSKVDELILVSICKRFIPDSLKKIKQYLARNKRAYLYKFYLGCFSGAQARELDWFKKNLIKSYLKINDLTDLLDGLDYLSCAQIAPESLLALSKSLLIKIIHGQEDNIAPFKEASDLASLTANVEFFLLPKVGHIPFLNQGFQDTVKWIKKI